MPDPDSLAPWITAPVFAPASTALPLFRRAITLDKPLAHASIQICGLGHFELRVNGQKIGDDCLEPAWTDYRKTCLYVARDITAPLRLGENVLGVLLGNGMYNVNGGPDAAGGKRYSKFKGSFGPPKLTARVTLEFADGTMSVLSTDETWKCAPGPITFSCIYGGEDFDARLDSIGWDSAGFDDSTWSAAALADSPGGALLPQTSPPVRVMERFSPITITEPEPGTFVYDLGQNFSGRPVITVQGSAGESVKLKTGELLDAAGRVTQKNTGGPVSFTYTLRGDAGGETWHPRFSYTGFRYVQVTGLKPLSLTGEFLYSAAKSVGSFECSSDLLNRIHRLILAAIKSNLHHVLTDCPHREKLGWLEQTHLMGDAIFYNFDVAALYTKISRDMRDAQHDNGCIPTIAPQYTRFAPPWEIFNDSPEWGSAIVINPWIVYTRTGDRAILDENYDAMKRYAAYLRSRETPDGLIDYGLGDWYDIGPGDPGFSKLTSTAVTTTAVYMYDYVVLHAAATRLGHVSDAAHYREEILRIRKAFNARFFNPLTQQYDRGSQTANAMALAGGFVDPPHGDAVLANLIADIRAHDNHITAGDIGFRFVLMALASAGRSDVIYDLLTRTDPPSYGAQLAGGATALAEAWDANPTKSQNHLMLGHAEVWFYESLAGIQVDLSRPKGARITINPQIVGDVTWVSASYESALGRISVRWKRTASQLDLQLDVPAETTLHLPHSAPRRLAAGHHEISAPL